MYLVYLHREIQHISPYNVRFGPGNISCLAVEKIQIASQCIGSCWFFNVWVGDRLLHSPNLVAIVLSRCQWGMIHCLQLAGITLLWLVGLNIDWDCLVPHCIMTSGNSHRLSHPSGSPFSPKYRQCFLLRLCRGTVIESRWGKFTSYGMECLWTRQPTKQVLFNFVKYTKLNKQKHKSTVHCGQWWGSQNIFILSRWLLGRN